MFRDLSTRNKWLVLLGILAVVGTVGKYVDPRHFDSNSAEHRADRAGARRDFASTVGPGISTEGADDVGLVLNINECLANLNRVLDAGNITDRLDQLDFEWVRCKESRTRITRPWR